MDSRVSRFRSEVRRLGGPGRGRRYPQGLRDLAVSYCSEMRVVGESLPAVAAELAVSQGTLQRWIDAADCAAVSSGQLREVVLTGGDSACLAVVTPGGYRVEGLSLADATTLLRSLG